MKILEKLQREPARGTAEKSAGRTTEKPAEGKEHGRGPWWKQVLHGCVFALLPIVLFWLMEFYEHNPFEEVREEALVLNILLFELLAWILFFLLGSGRAAIRILGAAALVFGLVNHYVMAFRSTPFVPWDIFSVKTAASVAGNYDFTPGVRVVVVTLLFVGILGLVQFLKFSWRGKIYIRLLPMVGTVALLGILGSCLQDETFQNRHHLYPFLFTPAYMTKVNGMAVTFTMNLAYVHVDKPKGYSAKECSQILEEYEKAPLPGESGAVSDGTPEKKYPNIIVVMDEAFSDLQVLGTVDATEDYMPFVHKLQQGQADTLTGTLHVSVCGGNTANSEFEFLTGNTMRFLPTGSIPYQQYIKGETYSLAGHLASLGYVTYGMHPYHASGWERESVYPMLGFAETYFKADYKAPAYVRQYISDGTSFEKILETLQEKPAGQPAFIFNVTMQNHGSYTDSYDNFTPDISVPSAGKFALDQYLSLLRLTDDELEKLVEALKDFEEDTLLVFFGDHQPNNAVAGSIADSSTREEQRYQVPCVIWANYDIPEEKGFDMSLNYLSAKALLTAGVPLSPYQRFLWELREYWPVLSAVELEESGQAQEEEDVRAAELYDTYQKLQYYQLFDGKGESDD